MKNKFVVALIIIQFVFLTWITVTPIAHQKFVYAQSLQPPPQQPTQPAQLQQQQQQQQPPQQPPQQPTQPAQLQQQQQPPQQQQNSNPIMVAAGGGNGTGPLTLYLPDKIEIKTGQSITWYNPTKVGEPHTVTFIFDNTTFAGVVSPLAVSNTTKFQPLPPGSNNAPILLPEKYGTNVIIALNARTFNPTVIDSSDNIKSMSPNANYTIVGTEKYVNSGWFLPKGQEQGYPGSGNTFTVKFEKPGTYNYICILHPWMTGSVTVR